jgi:hypothetical protein
MPRIFISYRREETAYPAGWLFDRLGARFGEDQVFKDVDSIDPGDDFTERITNAVGSCDVLLALIGEEWLTMADEDGGRRLDNPKDFVRLEIEAALSRDTRVVPVLVEGAAMPQPEELPPSLAPLARRQALELSPQRFDFDTNRLLDVLEKMVADGDAPPPPAAPRRIPRSALISAGVAAALLLVLVPLLVYLLRPDSNKVASSTPTATSAATENWVAEANDICERANEAIDDLPEPNAASLETLGADALVGYGTAAVNVNKRMVRDLGELSPPEDEAAAHRELVLRGAKMTEAAEEFFAALKVGDVLSAQEKEGELSAAGKAFDDHALKVGATTCAEGASLSGVALPTG